MFQRGMWIPQFKPDEDRHHQIFFRCSDCKPLKKACQFFGHVSDIVCDSEKLKTVFDTPLCSSKDCPIKGFMQPTHNLYQVFCDEDGNRFNVFFENIAQVERFFQRFPAKACLFDGKTWCKFLAIEQYHHALIATNEKKLTELTLRKVPIEYGYFKFVYVSGFLSDRIDE